MVAEDALKISQKYIESLIKNGISISKAIIFGSYARGDYTDESDIDLLLVSPLFDKPMDAYYGLIWKLTKIANYKIEPVPVGEKFFRMDTGSPIIEQAKIEGIDLPLP